MRESPLAPILAQKQSKRLWSMDPGMRHPGTTTAPGSQVVMVLVTEM